MNENLADIAGFIVQLDDDNGWDRPYYLANGHGDPPRTYIPEKAKQFRNSKEAIAGLRKAYKFRNFPRALIVPIRFVLISDEAIKPPIIFE